MITYQVKITVQKSIEAEWLTWMKTTHVPDVIATGLIRSYRLLKPDNMESAYLFHYDFDSQADLDKYSQDHAPALKNHPQEKFPDQFVAERTLLTWL